jgi:hypothetical protein
LDAYGDADLPRFRSCRSRPEVRNAIHSPKALAGPPDRFSRRAASVPAFRFNRPERWARSPDRRPRAYDGVRQMWSLGRHTIGYQLPPASEVPTAGAESVTVPLVEHHPVAIARRPPSGTTRRLSWLLVTNRTDRANCRRQWHLHCHRCAVLVRIANRLPEKNWESRQNSCEIVMYVLLHNGTKVGIVTLNCKGSRLPVRVALFGFFVARLIGRGDRWLCGGSGAPRPVTELPVFGDAP